LKEFEVISASGIMADHIGISPDIESVVYALFSDGEFDMSTPAVVIPRIDEAKSQLQNDPDAYRSILAPGTRLGLSRVRNMLDIMRAVLADHPEATVTGPVDPNVSATP
jgi:hypothetical protein